MSLKTPVELTPKQLAHVSQYVLLQPGEELLLVFDATVFNSADTGVAITDHRIAKFGLGSEGSARYAVAERPVASPHCSGTQLLARIVMLQSRAFADGTPWEPRESAALECVHCGHLALFTRPPVRLV